jgi:hypothetical protein
VGLDGGRHVSDVHHVGAGTEMGARGDHSMSTTLGDASAVQLKHSQHTCGLVPKSHIHMIN